MAANPQSFDDFLKSTTGGAAPDASTPTPVQGQSFDDFLKSSGTTTPQTLRNNLQFSLDASPDKEAGYRHLARFVGVPTDTVRAQPDAIKTQAALQQFDADKVANQLPATAQVLSDMDNTRMLHDDIPNMTGIESTMQAWNPSWGQRLMAWVGEQFRMPERERAQAANILAERQLGITAGQAREAVGGESELPEQFAGQAVHTASFGILPNTFGEAQTTAGRVGAGAGTLAGFVAGGPVKAAEYGLGKLDVTSALEAGAADSRLLSLLKATGSGAATLGTASALSEAGNALNSQTLGEGAAKVGTAGASGAAMGGTFGAVGRILPGNTLLQFLGRALANNVATDLEQGNRPWDDRPLDQKIMDYGLNTFFSLHGMSPTEAEPVQRAGAAELAAQDAQRVAGLSQLFAASKFRERDPEQFKQFVSDVADRANVPDLYVDAKQFAQVLDQSGVSAGELSTTMPDVAKQMREGLQTEGMVRIPIEDYAQKLAGSPVDEALQPHLRTSPDGMSFAEAQQYYQNQAAEMKASADKLVGERAQDDAFKQSGQQVEDTIRAQLDKTGRFPSDVNKAYASMWRSFFETTAGKTGQLPHELLAQYPTEVRSDHLAQPTLNQDYWTDHRPMTDEGGAARLHDLAPVFGEDIYGPNALQYFGSGDARERKVLKQLNALRGKPDAMVTIYRGVPEGAKEEINPGDWVTLSKEAAADYGKVISKQVPASHVTASADSLLENGYHPPVERTVNVPGFGEVKFNQAHDVELLGGSSNDGTTVYADKDWNPTATLRMADGSMQAVDRSPFLGVHELVERRLEARGLSYTNAHNAAERAEDDAVRAAGIDPKSYQESFDNEIKDAAKKADTGNPPPDLVAKPYDHPHSERAREALGRVDAAEGEQRSYNQPAAEGTRGSISFDPNDLSQGVSIGLFKNADLSTFLHESGHFFLEVYSDLASKMGPDSAIGKDMQTLLDSYGIKDVDTWRAMSMDEKREFHEQFARGFEQYLMEGKAPTTALQSLYGRFRAWLVNVYQSISQLHVQLSDDVRGVMDRMLASQEAIEQSQAARGMLPVFETKPEGMNDAAWGKYQDELRESTEQAISDLQAKSIKDMQWLSNAKDKAIKALQREAKAARAETRAKVEKEVDAMPLYKAERFLRSGEMKGPDGEDIKVEKGFKLNTDDLRRMHQPVDLADLKGLTSADGLHPDLVAEMFGFTSGDAMVRQLAGREPRRDLIEGLTDQRMLEEHGELTDPQSIERAAEAAIHNDVRTRVLARELNALAKATGSARLLAKAAGEAADAAINARKVRDIDPRQFQAQEGRAGKAAFDAHKRGDTQTAAVQKRAQLLNNQLARKAQDAQEMVRKALTYFKRFDRVSTLKAINPEDRAQILKLLGNYDFRINPTDEPTRAQKNLQQWLESQQIAGYSPLVDDAALQAQPRTQYRDMTVEQLRGLYDTVRSMEKIGRDKESADWEGQRMALDDLVNNVFVPKMQERGDNFTADQLYSHENNRDAGRVRLALDKMGSFVRSTFAELKPQYFKANYFDQHDILGPFHQLFDQVFEANYRKIDMTRAQSLAARALAEKLGKDWQSSLFDMVPNTTLIDAKASEEHGQFVPMRLTRDNLIQMAAHAGNESNFDKLAKGYGWKPEDVWAFLDGKLSAQDVEAVKAQWEWANQHWPEVKAQYERLGQVVPPKIEPRPYELRLADGSTVEMPGGYMPVRYDPLRSRLGDKQQAERVIKENDVRLGYDFFGRDTTTNGSMNARVDGYTDAIDLRHEALERAMAETVHDLAYREPLINVNKIISHSDFKRQFLKTYGREQYDALYTWLGRIANSENVDRQVGALGRILHYTRTGMVMNAIALRASTVLKHGGSAAIKSTGYFAGGGEKYYLARQAAMAYDYKAQLQEALEKFPEIRARALQQDRDYRATVSSLFTPESARSKAERFGHAAVAYADLFTAVATAHGAYDRAITEGIPKNQGGTGEPMTHAQAVRYANQVVREAHGSQIESARSNTMTNPHEGVKLFTTLYGFMNNTLGQTMDMADKFKTAGLSNPVIAARAMTALVVPALWAGVLNAGWPSKDDWGKWAGEALSEEAAGMIPFARDVYAFLAGRRSAGVVGVESWMQTVAQPLKDAANAAQGKKTSNVIAHVGDALGMGLHIPGLGQLSHSAQYLYNVHTGKEQPKNAAELAEGVALGHGARKKK